MDQVITFNKTYQDRLLEFTDVLSGYKVLSVDNIKKEWSFYLEVSVDPLGWQAVWKIPRLTCEEFGIAFPAIVLVYVENVNFLLLEAAVRVLAVQDEFIEVPEKHHVPLMQLWPTKEQDKSLELNLNSTANSLDMLRFFYLYILMPWDLEEEPSSDWLSKHLETRLHLYHDMRNGTIPVPTVEQLKGFINEAHRLQARRDKIVTQMDNETLTEEMEAAYVEKLTDIQIRLMEIHTNFEILENPTLRNAVLKKQGRLQPINCNGQHHYWSVFRHGKINAHTSFLDEVKKHVNDEDVEFVSTLSLALENANKNDSILLSSSKHVFESLGALAGGGVLKGVYSKEETIITSANDNITLDCNGDVTLENLTIDASSAQVGILVRSGSFTMKNCKIVGDGKSSAHQGIIVLAGGKLNMIDCDISRFYTAIVGNSGSSIVLQKCEIFDVNIGLKIYDRCQVKIGSSMFHHCKDYGVCVETDNSFDSNVYEAGGFAVLEVIPDAQINDVTGENNGKGDVLFNTKSKLQPIEDLFSDPRLNQTLNYKENSETSDEDMEINESLHEHNSTVIENKITVESVEM